MDDKQAEYEANLNAQGQYEAEAATAEEAAQEAEAQSIMEELHD